MLGHRRPRSSMAPAKIMAVAVTNVKPKQAYRMSGMSLLARDGAASTLCKPARDRLPRIGFVVCDWYSEYPYTQNWIPQAHAQNKD